MLQVGLCDVNWSKSHALRPNVPHAVVMFQETSTNNIEAIKRVNECLAQGRVICKGAYTKFSAWDSEVEGVSGLRCECDID